MTHPWLARFSDLEPVLVAPHLRDRFESSLLALDSRQQQELTAAHAAAQGGDDFWTEFGAYTKRLRPYVVIDGVLRIPVKGVLLNGFPYQFFDFATGYEYIGKALDRGMADPDVRGIALVIDSPGGMVAGNFDLVDRIHAARAQKPIRAFAAEAAYSAAYSIASAAQQLVVARTGGIGSIGVVTSHIDMSKALDDAGYKITFIHAGKHKVDGNPYEALPDDVKARIQSRVDGLYAIFVDTVARNRNLDAAAVRATEALTFTATEAIDCGLADSIGSLDGALADFTASLNNPDTGDETMSNPTVASLKADHPELAATLIEEGKKLGQADAEAKAKADADQAVAADRTRVATLDGLLAKMGGNPKAGEIVAAAKADGSTAEATALKLIDAGAPVQAAVLGAIQADDASAAAASPAAAAGGAGKTTASTPDEWKAEYAANPKLRADFATADDYVAFKKADARGAVKILTGRAAA